MEAIDLLVSRRSCVAAALGEPGPGEGELARILEAGIRVPDHKKLSPWRIQVLDGPGQARLGEVCAQAYRRDHPDASRAVVAAERARPCRSPVLLVVASRLDPAAPVPEIEQLLSGGAVCMNLLNAAHALGYAGQWLTDWPAYDARVKAALGHGEGDHVLGWIHLGTPTVAPTERWRAAVADVVSRWSAPVPPPGVEAPGGRGGARR